MELKNKTVVITGGTGGLGLALAISFLKENANVVVCSRGQDKLKNLPPGILGIKADVRKESDLKNLMEVAKEKFGKIDIWINNAGIWLSLGLIEETDWQRAHDLIEVNLFGTIYGSKAALIQMKRQGFGAIVNIISSSALGGRPRLSAYGTSKYAVMGFTQYLRKELAGSGIKVIAVYPGGMKTNLFDEKKPDDFNEYMDQNSVADKIIDNLKKDSPEEELVLKRPAQ